MTISTAADRRQRNFIRWFLQEFSLVNATMLDTKLLRWITTLIFTGRDQATMDFYAQEALVNLACGKGCVGR